MWDDRRSSVDAKPIWTDAVWSDREWPDQKWGDKPASESVGTTMWSAPTPPSSLVSAPMHGTGLFASQLFLGPSFSQSQHPEQPSIRKLTPQSTPQTSPIQQLIRGYRLRAAPVRWSTLPLFRQMIVMFGDAEVQLVGPGTQECTTAEIAFRDPADANRCLHGLKRVPQFRDIVLEPVVDDAALAIDIPWASLSSSSYDSMYSQLSAYGAIVSLTFEPRTPTSTTALCIFQDSRIVYVAARNSIHIGGLHILGRIVRVARPNTGTMNSSTAFSLPPASPPGLSTDTAPTTDANTGETSPAITAADDLELYTPPQVQFLNSKPVWADRRQTHPIEEEEKAVRRMLHRHSPSPATVPTSLASASPVAGATKKSNYVDLDAIVDGRETRTTIMLRNIPNKVDQKALKNFLDETNKYTYDFLYLRIDFGNKCNVGYAFVSFTRPEYVARLVRHRRGTKWSHYSSDKVIDVSFANFQGRDNLIHKFRNSPVMAADPAYRPKLYYTEGPEAGEEAPFPPPTVDVLPPL